MKNLKFNAKKTLHCFFSLLAISVLFSSCIKENGPTTVNTPYSLVLFVQATPDLPPVDFYLDNSIVNTSPLNFNNGFTYVSAYATTKAAYVYNHATNAKLLTDSLHLKANTAYSLFLAGAVASPQIVSLTDTVSSPPANSASIRFINLSPDAPAVDLAISGGAVIAGNKAFKTYSSFTPLAGNQTYTFVVKQAGTNTVLATLPAVKISAGSVYTFWLGGLAAGTTATDKLGLNIINNASF